MNLPNAPVPQDGFFVTHFLTVRDQAKSREFYVGILGGKVVAPENPCYIKLANSWIILNSGGGQPASRRHLGLLQAMEGERSPFLD